jgi:hypothetical protein
MIFVAKRFSRYGGNLFPSCDSLRRIWCFHRFNWMSRVMVTKTVIQVGID